MHWQQTEEALSEEVLIVGNTTRNTGRSNSFHVDTEAVVSLARAAINIAYMVGERYWPPCPGYEIISYKRGVPIKCPELWVRDEGFKSSTLPSLMPDLFLCAAARQRLAADEHIGGKQDEACMHAAQDRQEPSKLATMQRLCKDEMSWQRAPLPGIGHLGIRVCLLCNSGHRVMKSHGAQVHSSARSAR